MKTFSKYKSEQLNKLQDIYESFGDELLNDMQINEGLSDKFEKVKELTVKIKDKISSNISDAAKRAIENVKKKAGEKWEKIKDIYVTLVSFIDDTISKLKSSFNNISKLIGQTESEIEQTLIQIYLQGFAHATKASDKIFKLMVKFPETEKQMVLFNLVLLANIYLQSKGIIDLTTINDFADAINQSKIPLV